MKKIIKIATYTITLVILIFVNNKVQAFDDNKNILVYKDKDCIIKLDKSIELNNKNKFSNEEITNLLKNAEDKVFNMVYSTYKDIKIKEGKGYVQFEKEFDSEKKVYYYLKKYFSNNMVWKIINYFDIRYVNGLYCISEGDYGLKIDWNKTSIVNKKYIDKNTLEVNCREFEDNSYNNIKFKLIFEDNNWIIDDICFNSN